MSVVLRIGVSVAASVVLAGAVVYLFRHGAEAPDYSVFHGEPSELRSVWRIVRYALSLSGRGIIQLGCLLLIATPILRVAVSLVGFARQRDRTYLIVTLAVLAILAASLIGGVRV